MTPVYESQYHSEITLSRLERWCLLVHRMHLWIDLPGSKLWWADKALIQDEIDRQQKKYAEGTKPPAGSD